MSRFLTHGVHLIFMLLINHVWSSLSMIPRWREMAFFVLMCRQEITHSPTHSHYPTLPVCFSSWYSAMLQVRGRVLGSSSNDNAPTKKRRLPVGRMRGTLRACDSVA